MGRLRDAVSSGDQIEALTEVRDVLAATIEASPPQYVAALSRMLTEVLRELDSLTPATESNPLDDLDARRARRQQGA